MGYYLYIRIFTPKINLLPHMVFDHFEPYISVHRHLLRKRKVPFDSAPFITLYVTF
uniref:Uncharacterized protein n=1 Tax=Meloidogyne enterolobii TaxID=390850 RepID=A0A6V7WWS6_MELEN|nr:unnamed protein product [Meloidogyne enterolobii]